MGEDKNKKATRLNFHKGSQSHNPSQANGSANININVEVAIANLQKIAQKYVGVNNPQGFLTDLRMALGIPDTPGASKYGLVTILSGNDVFLQASLRITNHQANAEQYILHNANSEYNLSVVVRREMRRNTFKPHDEVRDFRAMPKKPLYAMDWLGMILWSIFVLSIIFVAQYAYQLEWLHSPYIRIALGVACISLAINLIRMQTLRHPFIELAAFNVKRVPQLLVAFLFLGILLASKNVLQNTFTNAVLHFDALNAGRLKFLEFVGALLGAAFSFYALIFLKWKHRTVTFIGFTAVVIYVMMMYFLISPDTNIEKLYLPLILCNFGHLCIFIALTVYIQATAPFKNYFQILCILGFVRTGIASPIGDCIYQYGINGLIGKHLSMIGENINLSLQSSMSNLSMIGSEAMCATLMELYGYTFIFGVSVLLLIGIMNFFKTQN